jgi:hypothetical protein
MRILMRESKEISLNTTFKDVISADKSILSISILSICIDDRRCFCSSVFLMFYFRC